MRGCVTVRISVGYISVCVEWMYYGENVSVKVSVLRVCQCVCVSVSVRAMVCQCVSVCDSVVCMSVW